MDATQALRSVGGVADSSTLVKMVGRRRFRQAVRRELVVRAGPDRYVLPGAKVRLAAAASARVLRVVHHADAGADNSFESVLRSLCIEAGFEMETHVQIGDLGWCDIADRSRMLVVEGESFRYHGSERAFLKDVRRYTGFGRLGWLVIRFTVDDVLERPDYVLEVLRDVLAIRPRCPATTGSRAAERGAA